MAPENRDASCLTAAGSIPRGGKHSTVIENPPVLNFSASLVFALILIIQFAAERLRKYRSVNGIRWQSRNVSQNSAPELREVRRIHSLIRPLAAAFHIEHQILACRSGEMSQKDIDAQELWYKNKLTSFAVRYFLPFRSEESDRPVQQIHP